MVRFDQPMDKASTEAAFAIEPAVNGALALDNTELIFTPKQPLERGEMYRLTVSQDAKSTDGKTLAAPVDLRFATVGFLQVTNTQPADGNQEVDADTTIAVVFNRPVVALTSVEQQKGLPQPLTFDPPVAGKGTWLNTSIYQFQPDQPLAGGADYKATVLAGLEDTSGGLLAEDFVFSFRTTSPIVTSFQPEGEQVAPTAAMTVTFSQPMDPASTEAAFNLAITATNETVAGSFKWMPGNRMMRFTPAKPLEYATAYRALVDTSARSASGAGTLRDPFRAPFSTAPKIGVG